MKKTSIIVFSKHKESYHNDYLLEKNIEDIKKIVSKSIIRKVHTGNLDKTGYGLEIICEEDEDIIVLNYLKEDGFKDCLIINQENKNAYVLNLKTNKTNRYAHICYHHDSNNLKNKNGYNIYIDDEVRIYTNQARSYLINIYKFSKESADSFIDNYYTADDINFHIKLGLTPIESICVAVLGY